MCRRHRGGATIWPRRLPVRPVGGEDEGRVAKGVSRVDWTCDRSWYRGIRRSWRVQQKEAEGDV